MVGESTAKPIENPDDLLRKVEEAPTPPSTEVLPQHSMLEEDIRRAYRVVEADLTKIDALREQQVEEIPYAEILSSQLHDKLAAIVFLAKHKLYDITYGTPTEMETIEARHDLSGLIEILFVMQAVDGLMILYDFTVQQQALHDAAIWQNYNLYYLRLIAMMPETMHPRIMIYLKERPIARRQVEQLMGSPDPATANVFRALGEEYLRARNEATDFDDLAASTLYARLYYQFDQHAPDEQTLGLTVRLATETRLQQAVKAGDVATVVRWIVEGSLTIARLAFQLARSGFSVWVYATLLGQLLQRKDISPTVLTAAVLELGNLNKMRNAATGEVEINHLLADFALSSESALAGVARVAVWKLREVNALNEIITVIENAPVLEVAEEGIRALRDMRHLALAEPIVQRRPNLMIAYKAAQHHLQEIERLMTTIQTSEASAAALTALDRLQQLRAILELEHLAATHPILGERARTKLAETPNDIGE